MSTGVGEVHSGCRVSRKLVAIQYASPKVIDWSKSESLMFFIRPLVSMSLDILFWPITGGPTQLSVLGCCLQNN